MELIKKTKKKNKRKPKKRFFGKLIKNNKGAIERIEKKIMRIINFSMEKISKKKIIKKLPNAEPKVEEK